MAPNISEISAVPHGSMMAGDGVGDTTGLDGPLTDYGTQPAAGGVLGDVRASGHRAGRRAALQPQHGGARRGRRRHHGRGGAVDRITHEICSRSKRKRSSFGSSIRSGSFESQRDRHQERFERIYEELGVVQASNNAAFKRHDSKPLLSPRSPFGQKDSLLTQKPTDDVQESDVQRFQDYDGSIGSRDTFCDFQAAESSKITA